MASPKILPTEADVSDVWLRPIITVAHSAMTAPSGTRRHHTIGSDRFFLTVWSFFFFSNSFFHEYTLQFFLEWIVVITSLRDITHILLHTNLSKTHKSPLFIIMSNNNAYQNRRSFARSFVVLQTDLSLTEHYSFDHHSRKMIISKQRKQQKKEKRLDIDAYPTPCMFMFEEEEEECSNSSRQQQQQHRKPRSKSDASSSSTSSSVE